MRNIITVLAFLCLAIQLHAQSKITPVKFRANDDSLHIQVNMNDWKGGIKSIEFQYTDTTKLMRTLFIKGRIYKISLYSAETGGISDEYFFHNNGIVDEEKHYNSGKLSGKNITYYRNGKVRMIYTYENGILVTSKKYSRFRGNKPL